MRPSPVATTSDPPASERVMSDGNLPLDPSSLLGRTPSQEIIRQRHEVLKSLLIETTCHSRRSLVEQREHEACMSNEFSRVAGTPAENTAVKGNDNQPMRIEHAAGDRDSRTRIVDSNFSIARSTDAV